MSALLKCPKMVTMVVFNDQLEVLKQSQQLKAAFPGMPSS